MSGDSIQPENTAEIRDPETGDWHQSWDDPLKEYADDPATDLDYLQGLPDDGRIAIPISTDHFSGITFQEALNYINPNYRIVAGRALGGWEPTDEYFGRVRNAEDLSDVESAGSDLAGKWGAVKDEIIRATSDFNRALDSLMDDTDHWDGETKIEAFENVRQSFVAPEKISQSAGAMQILVDAFTQTIDYVYKNIEGNRPNYEYNVNLTNDENHDEYVNEFNSFAQKVMGGVYRDNIDTIAANNPLFTTGELPDLGGEPDPEPDETASDDGGGGGGGEAGAFNGPKPFTAPEIPEFTGPAVPDLTDTMPAVPPSANPTPAGLNSPTDAMKAATDAARNALGAATDAAKQAADSAHKPFGSGPGDPPEGVLGLGPKGLGGSPSGGGAGGRTGAGAGSPLPRSLADGRPTGAAVTSSTRLPSTAGATGAGPGMMGPPGAGAPTGAQRGGDGNNGHQVLKALRRKKNGQEVASEADAVVAVLGAPGKPAKSKADQTEQTDLPGTEVRPVTQGAHRPEQPTQVQNP